MSPCLTVTGLTKRFGSLTAVDGISFSLNPGEILGFLGQNGAGKTTTIQMLLGVMTPESGEIAYFGKNFAAYRTEILEEINFSSAYTNLPNNLLVRDTLHYLSYFYRLPDRRARLAEIVAAFDLGRLLKQRISTLSSGEQTRLNLAKAFFNRPKVLLLDEPTASLDPENARFVRDYIDAERRRTGLAVLFTSHNMVEVEEVCDRVIFLHAGRITLDDTPLNLARKLDLSTVSLLIDPTDTGFSGLVAARGLAIERSGPEVSLRMPETEVPQFIQALVGHNVRYHGLTVRRAGLEEYFFQNKKSPSSGGPHA
jgi:ABC-2 type transport system ATP-binding protein